MTQTRRLLPYAGAETHKRRITTLDNPILLPYSPNDYISVSEAAQFAKCSVSKIRTLYRDYPIAKNVLGTILINKPALQQLIDGV